MLIYLEPEHQHGATLTPFTYHQENNVCSVSTQDLWKWICHMHLHRNFPSLQISCPICHRQKNEFCFQPQKTLSSKFHFGFLLLFGTWCFSTYKKKASFFTLVKTEGQKKSSTGISLTFVMGKLNLMISGHFSAKARQPFHWIYYPVLCPLWI